MGTSGQLIEVHNAALQAVPRAAELIAPPAWRTVDFISDLHLHASEPATFALWQQYMQATPADAVFLLGDLFEVWIGDDVLASQSHAFEAVCTQVLKNTSARVPVFLMHGNRDFLIGPALTAACGVTLLADPTVLSFNQQRWLLSHGDELCVDDVAYMEFRQQVRAPAWQQAFLAKPLAERSAIARALRAQSEARKKSGAEYADVDAGCARHWLQAANARILIHGHTHRPARHDLGDGFSRVVLSDWDAQAALPRAEVLRLSSGGLQRIRLA